MLIFDLNRPILAYQHTKTCLCLSALFMLTIADTPLYACQAFLCLSVDKLLQIMSIIVEKNKIDLSQNDPFFESGLYGLMFCSCQKVKCHLLDLSVLNIQSVGLQRISFFMEIHSPWSVTSFLYYMPPSPPKKNATAVQPLSACNNKIYFWIFKRVGLNSITVPK
jgi:hypothetical protein